MCKGSNIRIFEKKNRRGILKLRVAITDVDGEYDLPYTGVDALPSRFSHNEEVLVVLGLTRPWAGFKNEYSPLRCYLLVLRIIRKPLTEDFGRLSFGR